MILNNAPQDQAVLSNVGQIGEFRIRNSAKAFNILSSGLYANKIRAIIRELSCNAVDSHVSAGRSNTPFDVHLPNQLEPWFSIRDYGTGLTHEQVTSIYTTYFESTKTDSNDFIGALGLGSKSPFSYTDNFTVTAIRDGRCGIYTAFINEQGVPSIALMTESATAEPDGVEVKFSVNDRWDFDKFREEARTVYTYFALRPVVSGASNFQFTDVAYQSKDIVPGVHHIDGTRGSRAVMGNIAYPIDIPHADTTLGNLRGLLNCGLELHFAIGELDFQASREGLSYIPSTVEAIRRKLVALNSQLAVHIAAEADAIDNLWARAEYLIQRVHQPLWEEAVIKYVTDTKFPLSPDSPNRYNIIKSFNFSVETLAKKYNINIRGFTKTKGTETCPALKQSSEYDKATSQHVAVWKIRPEPGMNFVVTDTKVGALERAKYHWRKNPQTVHTNHVMVIEPVDKKKPVDYQQFFKDIYQPKDQCIFYASQLDEKQRSSNGNWGRAAILKLEERERSRYNRTMVWTNAGTASEFDSNRTFYYVEMNGWNPAGVPTDIKVLRDTLKRAGVFDGDIYGVRKSDIAQVKKQKNWVELNSFVRQTLSKIDANSVMGLVKTSIDFDSIFKYTNKKLNTDSPYYQLYSQFKDIEAIDSGRQHNLEHLFRLYGVQTQNKIDPKALITQYREQVEALKIRYPLLTSLTYSVKIDDVVAYINMVDQIKGV